MGIIYPDNTKRADRVQQLANDIAHYQAQVKQYTEDILKDDKDTLEILDKIAKASGHDTLEEYIDAAMKLLPEDDRKAYERVKSELNGQDTDIDIARKVGGGIVALGVGCGVALVTTRVMLQINTISLSSQLVARGLVLIITGSVSQGTRLIRVGSQAISDAVSGLGDVGQGIAKGLRVLKIAGKVLGAISIALEGVLLIYEAVTGADQRKELQKAILELCSRRFMVRKIQESARVTNTYRSKANSIVSNIETLKEEDMSEAVINAATKKEIEKQAAKLNADFEGITDDRIWEELDALDKSRPSWTDEDPNLATVLQWISDHLDDDEKQ